MKKFIVHTVNVFRFTYVVEAENSEYAKDSITNNVDGEEVDQEWIGENIVYVQEINDEQLSKFCMEALNGHVVDKLILKQPY